jgi:hypothetical protein
MLRFYRSSRPPSSRPFFISTPAGISGRSSSVISSESNSSASRTRRVPGARWASQPNNATIEPVSATAVSVSGKRDFGTRENGAQTTAKTLLTRARETATSHNAGQCAAFLRVRGKLLFLRMNAWWTPKDSNLQTHHYERRVQLRNAKRGLAAEEAGFTPKYSRVRIGRKTEQDCYPETTGICPPTERYCC